MGSFTERLEKELQTAAKTQAKARLSSLRLIKNTLHNREIDARRKLTDAEIMQALAAMIKQRRDSIEQFTMGKRQDLVDKEEAEVAVIQEFMPQQLTEKELLAEIEAAIAEVKAASPKDMGKVMKLLTPRIIGRADTKAASELVKSRLAVTQE
ncbi:MAG: GatB/YqeY domain-containing protein [Deltaproteobacteria bacterium]|nr:GatB/YqeY domain-containing protein [Deltaproteobacteria bacterium]